MPFKFQHIAKTVNNIAWPIYEFKCYRFEYLTQEYSEKYIVEFKI